MRRIIFITICGMLVFFDASAQSVFSLSKTQKGELVSEVADLLEKNYVFADIAKKMGDYIRERFKNGAYDSLDHPGWIAARISTDLLSVYHDSHLRLRYSPEMAASLGKGNELNAKDQEKSYALEQQINFGFNKVEILDGNIGYIKFNQFSAPRNDAREAAFAAFSFVQHSKALILDLRDNGGGEPEMIKYICNFLFPEKTHLNDLYIRRNQSLIQFWTEPDMRLKSLFTIPIYVLTSKKTFSGAEEFSYDLQTRKRALIIGETTGGGAHPTELRAAGNGFVLFLPFARAINPLTHTNWEGRGVHPDIEVSAANSFDTAVDRIKKEDGNVRH